VNIYIGNLSYSVKDNDLQRLFSEFGAVTSAKVIVDMDSGRSKGFGFVEMSSKEEGEAAIGKLNGTDLQGRSITVNEARPKTDRGFGGGGGGGRRDRF
jgi:RNA recognition motif-containing protein